ncbi:MAG: hypothetical protein IJW64_05440 [Clostridia bacterium]|nr:hypothetical protein [Clostridia bacterium]
MEKFGLFDLIDKLSLSPNGKKEFAKKETEQTSNSQSQPVKSELTDTAVYPPKHYMMNEKMIDFYKKHDEFKKTICKTK